MPDTPAVSLPEQIHPVLLCGGAGTRLWPLSRASYPKQFVRLMAEQSLFQASVLRVTGPGFAPAVVVSADAFRFIVTEQMAALETTPAALLIEPSPRDTGPALLSAALWLEARHGPDAPLLLVPSDHVMPDTAAFQRAVRAALPRALAGALVTFGVVPDRAETGYGYLELPAPLTRTDAPQKLVRFVEKPDADRAARMLTGGRHLWNAGLLLATPRALRAAYQAHAPGLLSTVAEAVQAATQDLGFLRLAPAPWDRTEKISADYAILEKQAGLEVMPLAGRWSDLGDWDAVHREGALGRNSDETVTSGPVTALDCSGSLLRSEDPHLELVGLGLTDIIAIAQPDAVLVAHRSRAQDLRRVVTALEEKSASQAVQAARDHRPWGGFETLARGPRFAVKRITVQPGGALSLQSHHHRAEHWIVVSGTARVTIGEDVQLVTENQSVYIPLGARHRLENPGKVAMELIEIQTGAYLGEDDIERYEDLYARE